MAPSWTSVKIAPGFTIADWQALRGQLESSTYDENWEILIGHVWMRLSKRFLEPADVLLRHEQKQIRDDVFPEGLGFAVLALDCLLIEMLCGYERGEHTVVGETGKTFESFLSTRPRFKEAFSLDDRAATFCAAVRHGLLHDGETRKGWIIWQGSDDGPLIEDWGDGLLRLYRSAFHNAVKEYVDGYFARLRAEGEDELRMNLIKRLDQLCEESAPP